MSNSDEEWFDAASVGDEDYDDALDHQQERLLVRDDSARRLSADPDRLDSGGEASTSPNSIDAHRAAFVGDVEAIQAWLESTSRDEWVRLDPQGNSVLHLAVLRGCHAVLRALLEAGFPPNVRNGRGGWVPMDDAIALKDEVAIAALYTASEALAKADIKAKKRVLLASLVEMPDYQMQIKWELGSLLFGPLLRRFAPHDAYQVWKRGTRLRVDGTLMGPEDPSRPEAELDLTDAAVAAKPGAGGLLPWRRGHFSLLCDAVAKPTQVFFVDHDRRKWADLGKQLEVNRHTTDESVRLLMSAGKAAKTKVRTHDVRFKPARTWLGQEATEKMDGWSTKVYDISGKLSAVNHTKGQLCILPDATFEEYLALQLEGDKVREVCLDAMSLATKAAAGEGSAKQQRKAKQQQQQQQQQKQQQQQQHKPAPASSRKFTGKCWMAAGFPMSLAQLLPLLGVIGTANKHVQRAARFLEKHAAAGHFPVRLQVPLLLTVYLVVANTGFQLLSDGGGGDSSGSGKGKGKSSEGATPRPELTDEFYDLPEGYAEELPVKKPSAVALSRGQDGELDMVAPGGAVSNSTNSSGAGVAASGASGSGAVNGADGASVRETGAAASGSGASGSGGQ